MSGSLPTIQNILTTIKFRSLSIQMKIFLLLINLRTSKKKVKNYSIEDGNDEKFTKMLHWLCWTEKLNSSIKLLRTSLKFEWITISGWCGSNKVKSSCISSFCFVYFLLFVISFLFYKTFKIWSIWISNLYIFLFCYRFYFCI